MTLAPLLAAALLLPTSAQAADAYMFGGGLTVGTMVAPGEYPPGWPKAVRNADDTGIEKVKGDVHIGLESVYYLDEGNRVGAGAALGFGGEHFDRNLLLKYDRVWSFGAADMIVGGGLGVGKTTFSGKKQEQLTVSYYPFRVQAGPVFRQDFLAEQVLLYGQWNAAWKQLYVDVDGVESETSGAAYLMIGAEIQVMFGNFSS